MYTSFHFWCYCDSIKLYFVQKQTVGIKKKSVWVTNFSHVMKQNYNFVFRKVTSLSRTLQLCQDLLRCNLQFLQVSGKLAAGTFRKILKHIPAFGCRGVYPHLNYLTHLSKINSPYTLTAILSWMQNQHWFRVQHCTTDSIKSRIYCFLQLSLSWNSVINIIQGGDEA